MLLALHRFQNEEIGRIRVTEVAGETGTGEYSGDHATAPGDVVRR